MSREQTPPVAQLASVITRSAAQWFTLLIEQAHEADFDAWLTPARTKEEIKTTAKRLQANGRNRKTSPKTTGDGIPESRWGLPHRGTVGNAEKVWVRQNLGRAN
jgi:hypothetical protein